MKLPQITPRNNKSNYMYMYMYIIIIISFAVGRYNIHEYMCGHSIKMAFCSAVFELTFGKDAFGSLSLISVFFEKEF